MGADLQSLSRKFHFSGGMTFDGLVTRLGQSGLSPGGFLFLTKSSEPLGPYIGFMAERHQQWALCIYGPFPHGLKVTATPVAITCTFQAGNRVHRSTHYCRQPSFRIKGAENRSSVLFQSGPLSSPQQRGLVRKERLPQTSGPEIQRALPVFHIFGWFVLNRPSEMPKPRAMTTAAALGSISRSALTEGTTSLEPT